MVVSFNTEEARRGGDGTITCFFLKQKTTLGAADDKTMFGFRSRFNLFRLSVFLFASVWCLFSLLNGLFMYWL